MRFLILLIIISCNIKIANTQLIDFELYSDSARCYNDSSGSISIKMITGKPKFEISLYDKRPAIKQKVLLKFSSEDTIIIIDKLPAKLYYITVKDYNNSILEKQIKIHQPDKLTYNKISIETGLSNPDSSDAILKVNPCGGTPPYSIIWDSNTHNQVGIYARNIGRGSYSCIINDANNCGPLEATIAFNEFLFKDFMGTK